METHPWKGSGPVYDAIIADMETRGWRRRAFGPPSWDKGPWFCSYDCAHESYNAKMAEEYWQQKEFEKYCKSTVLPPILWGPLLFAAILIATALLGDCIHARL